MLGFHSCVPFSTVHSRLLQSECPSHRALPYPYFVPGSNVAISEENTLPGQCHLPFWTSQSSGLSPSCPRVN